MQGIKENKVEVLGRLIPDSGKIHQNQEIYNTFGGRSICTLKAVHYKDPPKILIGYETEKRMNKIIQLGNLRKDTKNFTNPQTGRIYSAEGIAPTLNTCQGEVVNQKC